MQPIRIQRSRKSKQVSPNGLPIVYVGRPGIWGNPYRVKNDAGVWRIMCGPYKVAFSQNESSCIDMCIKLFEAYIKAKEAAGQLNIKDLKGKNLSCWCALNCKCHADVLLKLANE